MRKLTSVICVLVVTVMGGQHASAQIVPFKSVGTANEYDTSTGVFGGIGRTAHLGRSAGGGFAVPVGLPEGDPDFGNPLVLGGNFDVLSTEIFFAIVGAQYDQGRAAVLAMVLLFSIVLQSGRGFHLYCHAQNLTPRWCRWRRLWR